ncbi:MAG: DNA-processing protein DprA [Cyanobacteria bacterium P01_E01_bin.6]
MFGQLSERSSNTFSPALEISSYEALWTRYNTYPQLAKLFKRFEHALPSTVVSEEGFTPEEIQSIEREVESIFSFKKYASLFYRDFEYPERLRDARHPVEVLYYRGNLDLLSSKSVAVVGARKASEDGLKRARKITKLLVENDFTVMSGLAEGIDTAAHTEAIALGGRTIGVMGTALNDAFPKQNKDLQNELSRNYLIVSQVPFVRYSRQNYSRNRWFFPERNKTMSALSMATVIVEASDTSGTLIQAQAAFEQGRKLFILKSCFEQDLEWPNKFLAKGAIKIEDGTEILDILKSNTNVKASSLAKN